MYLALKQVPISKTEVIQTLFSDQNGIKMKVNNKPYVKVYHLFKIKKYASK